MRPSRVIIGLIIANLAQGELLASSETGKPGKANTKRTSTHQVSSSKRPAATSNSTPNVATAADSPIWKSFVDMRRRYRLGDINDQALWSELSTIIEQLNTLPPAQQAAILQTQANILNKIGYPILAAVHAAQALRQSSAPLDDDYKRSWQILREVSRQYPIQNLLEIVAENAKLNEKNPPAFGSDWNYIEGNVLAKDNLADKAMASYAKVKVTDRYFFPAKYQQAMLLLDAGKANDSIAYLKAIVYPASQELSTLSSNEKTQILDDANMALARIYYEQRQFPMAMKHYRLIDRNSNQFYDSLFEQSWALFMAGFPNHALGTIHSVRSPFYKDTFNPEATMLSSIIYYWMCRYDDSRNELADFIEVHQGPIKSLSEFLARKSLTDENAYYIFENTVTGVSSEGLGMPRNLLNSAAERDSMMHVRDQYSAVLSELQRIEVKGIFGSKTNITVPRGYLDSWAQALRKDIGRRFLIELRDMKANFDRLAEQAQFLYVELLMSQKDQLLGKELHSNTKIDKVSQRENISGWGKKTLIWASDDKMEYWQDEVGFHIYKLQPLCKTE